MILPILGIVVVGSAAGLPISAATPSWILDLSFPERPRPGWSTT